MTELDFIISLRRILMSAIDLIDRRYKLGKYAQPAQKTSEPEKAGPAHLAS